MDGLVLFLILVLAQLFVLYRIARLLFWRQSPLGFLEFCISIPAAIGVTVIAVTVIGYAGSRVHIPIDYGLALMLSIVGIPLLYIAILILSFRSLKYAKNLIANFLKNRRTRRQFIVARKFIHHRQYQKAQTVLSKMSDPRARQWETKLSQLMQHNPNGLRPL
ncbi:MAG: hypothetical protein GC179_16215 [Anaerolineaceae bacterium]|nr:hypothetical protein [Anaerolineaceae bacterium]